MSQPASLPAATLAQTQAELRLTARRGENVLVTIIVPAVVLLFFASTGILPTLPGRAVDFLLPGSMALAVIATSLVNLGIATAYERQYGVLKRLGGSPLGAGGLLIAKIGAVVVVELAQLALLTVIAVLLLGWGPAPTWSPLGLVGVAALGTFTFAGLGLLLAGAMRAEATLAFANALFIAAVLFGGVILPLDHLPDAIAAIAGLLPAGALSEAFRAAFGADVDVARPLAVLLGWGIGGVALAVHSFRWE